MADSDLDSSVFGNERGDTPPSVARNEIAARMATDWWADRLMSGDKRKFKDTLYPLVLADLNEHGQCNLECDYDPFGHLLTAVRAAGLECRGFMFSARGILPQKHVLDVLPYVLKPKEGYGNWTADIPVPQTVLGTDATTPNTESQPDTPAALKARGIDR